MFHLNSSIYGSNSSIPIDYFGVHFDNFDENDHVEEYANNIIFAGQFRQKNDLCKLYGSAVGCKYSNCLYSHRNPHSVKICANYKKNGKCISGQQCKYRHSLPYKPIFFIDDDNIKYDSAMIYILEKDEESQCIVIELFDYTKYINYYDQTLIYNELFSSSNTILSEKQLNLFNNKYIYIISYWFRECNINSMINIWPNHLSHFIIKHYFYNFKQTLVPIKTNKTTNTNGGDSTNSNSNICTVINLDPKHKYYICMKTADKNTILSSPYSDLQSFITHKFVLTEDMIKLYCKAFESFIIMIQTPSENRLKLWNIMKIKGMSQRTDIVINEMICSWLCLVSKKLNKNRTGISIPAIYHNKIGKQVIMEIKKLLPSNQCDIMTKTYFEQDIPTLLNKLSMRQILLDAF